MIAPLDLGGYFSMAKWSKVSVKLGVEVTPDIEEISTKMCFQKELKDLQNRRMWATAG